MKILQEANEKIVRLVQTNKALSPGACKASEFNYVLPSDGQMIIYNTLYGSVAALEIGEFELYESLDTGENDELREQFISQGFWVGKEIKERRLYLKTVGQIKEHRTRKTLCLTILPTLKCNARCFYCFEKGSLKTDMTKETADNIIEYVCKKGVSRVNFSWFGGEPMVHYDIMQYLCESLVEKGIDFSSAMVTNGYLLSDDETIEKLIQVLCVRKVQISLDGLHDTYRRRKNYINACKDPFLQVIHNIHLLAEHKVKVSIRLNIDKNNIDEMEELCHFLAGEFADEKGIFVYGEFIRDDACKNTSIFVSDDERRMVMERLLPILMDAGLYPDTTLRRYPKIHACMYDMPNSFVINPNGTICKCENECGKEEYQVGSVNSREGWREAEANALPKVTSQKECGTCVFFPLCFGGCQYNDNNHLARCFSDKYIVDIILRNYLNKKMKEEF